MPELTWDFIGKLSDVLGIISVVISIISISIISRISDNLRKTKVDYMKNKNEILTTLLSLRESIYEDNLDNIKIRSGLREELNYYFQNYWKIIPFNGWCRILISIRYLNKGSIQKNKEKLCGHIDYLVAKLRKDEVT